MAIITLELEQATNKETLNAYLRNLSLEGSLQYQIDFTTSTDIVSTDLVGNRHASIVDSHATLVHDSGRQCTLYVWYDNEFGYACQVTRLLETYCSRATTVFPRLSAHSLRTVTRPSYGWQRGWQALNGVQVGIERTQHVWSEAASNIAPTMSLWSADSFDECLLLHAKATSRPSLARIDRGSSHRYRA